jgi:trehalose-6-phosphate synthase/trehalose-6-phosphatase
MDQCRYPCTWIGWPGIAVDVGEQEHVRDNLVINRDYVPVFVREVELDLCYAGFCKKVLWPLMHTRALTTAFHIKANAEGNGLIWPKQAKYDHYNSMNDRRSRTNTLESTIDDDDDAVLGFTSPFLPQLSLPNGEVATPPILTPSNSSRSSSYIAPSPPSLPPSSTTPSTSRDDSRRTKEAWPSTVFGNNNSNNNNSSSSSSSNNNSNTNNNSPGFKYVSGGGSTTGSTNEPHQMKDMWKAYVSTNQRFAETIRDIYEDGDMIWVHGYHLMLVPHMIREYLPNATIGFNMHIPFPTSEIFRLLPWRRDILIGMLNADFIAFQVPGHSRHFLHCCTRILLGTSITSTQITYRGHVTRILVCPIGVDLRRMGIMQRRRAVRDRALEFQKRFQRKFVIIGVDRCVQSSGIVQKLMAFEEFLDRNLKLSDVVVLVQIVLPINSRLVSSEGKQLRRRIDQVVGRTNAKFANITSSSRPIYCLHQDLESGDLLSLYETADCVLVTPIKEGMNTVPFEYLVCRDNRGLPGTVIVSEFAGCASSLSGAIIVNPASTDAMATAIAEALTMSEAERRERHENMSSIASTFTAQRWLRTSTDLLKVILNEKEAELKLGINGRKRSRLNTLPIYALKNAFTRHLFKQNGIKLDTSSEGSVDVKKDNENVDMEIEKKEIKLKMVQMIEGKSNIGATTTVPMTSTLEQKEEPPPPPPPPPKQLIVIDFEDVIVQAQSLFEMTMFVGRVKKMLISLCNLHNVQVLVMSTRPREIVADLLSDVPCWLSAEHGHVVRLSNYTEKERIEELDTGVEEIDTKNSRESDEVIATEEDGKKTISGNSTVAAVTTTTAPTTTAAAATVTSSTSSAIQKDQEWQISGVNNNWYRGMISPFRLAEQDWFKTILQIFHHYGNRTPGAVVETTPVSISLHFEDADQNYASSIAKQLMSTLSETIGGFPIRTHLGRRSVDVVHVSVNKCAAVKMAILKLTESNSSNYDNYMKCETNNQQLNGEKGASHLATILCMLTGHEATDEHLFKYLSDNYTPAVLYDGELKLSRKDVGITEDTAVEAEKEGKVEETKDLGEKEGNENMKLQQQLLRVSLQNERVIDEDKEQQEGKKVQEVQTKEEESMPIVDNEEKPSTMVILCTLNEQKSSSTTNATFMVETRQEAFDLLNELSLAVTNQ